MSLDFRNTTLWARTLADQGADDPDAAPRALLRNSYLQMREAVKPLAGEIALSMPSFTVHSIEHCDALWQVGSTLMPDDFEMTPAEAFVLGGAFLLHDLGMGLSAYEGGEAELVRDPLYKDLIAQAIRGHALRAGSPPEGPALKELEGNAIAAVLRRRHARQAERLLSRTFKTTFNDSYQLIEKTDLRHAWGSLIGRIAHSHWMNVDELEREFSQIKGSVVNYPVDWQVDPLKVACALRLADACHIDAGRAPTYLSAIRAPEGVSADHWYFQERLTQPRLELDRLVYTANVEFDSEHATQWWLAYETANMISNELQRVDALCQDLGRPRFAARSVAGADSPERFQGYVGVQGWTPTDAKLKVSSVEDLAASLGGRNLYGDQPVVAIRELIANAADAIRARVTQYNVSSDTKVYVSLTEHKDSSWWLEVEDHGIGMSANRMLTSLTDFGHSGWTSADVLDDYPGLVSKGYSSIGKFGVGFYSIFMVADRVEVRSLKYHEASRETNVLIFPFGLSGRPLLRAAHEREEIHVGGTAIRLRLREHPLSEGGLLQSEELDISIGDMFRTLLRSMCALLEFDVEFKGPGEDDFQTVVSGGDWKVCSPSQLFENAYAQELRPSNASSTAWAYLGTSFSSSARDLTDASGDILGRASLDLEDDQDHVPWWTSPRAKVYVGGLAAGEIYGMLGVFVGEPLRADRLRGFPTAPLEELRRWASEQAESQMPGAVPTERTQRTLNIARGLGARLDEQPVAWSADGHVSPAQLEGWLHSRNSVLVVPPWELVAFTQAGRLKLVEREYGLDVNLPDNGLYGDLQAHWIFPEEVRKFPKDDRFKDYGVLESSSFNATYWWHCRGAIGFPSILLESIMSVWDMSTEEVANGTVFHQYVQLEDRRFELEAADGTKVRIDALEITRKLAVS